MNYQVLFSVKNNEKNIHDCLSAAVVTGTLTDNFCSKLHPLPYFFGYKTEFFSFQNNPKDLDLSYKTGLDLLDRLGRVKLVL